MLDRREEFRLLVAGRHHFGAFGIGDAGDGVDLVLQEQRHRVVGGSHHGDVVKRELGIGQHQRQLRLGPGVVVDADGFALELGNGDRLALAVMIPQLLLRP